MKQLGDNLDNFAFTILMYCSSAGSSHEVVRPTDGPIDTVQSYARLLLCLIENRVPCKIGIRIPKPARMLAIHAWLLCKHCECVIVVLEPVSPWFTYNRTVSNSASVVPVFRAKYCCHLAQYCVHRVWNINCRTIPYTTYELPSIICSHAQNTARVSQK